MAGEILIAPTDPAHPFHVEDLPLIGKLGKAAHHRFKKRWTKRFGKRPARLAYDFVESWLTPTKPLRTLRALRLLENAGYILFQPCWRINAPDGDVIFPELGGHLPDEMCRLALVPFATDQRFMLSQQMNVFACHKTRLHDLKEDGFNAWSSPA